ncbi:MAG: PQQ-binding-like beta-propeller repeat protein [Kibdelosporangium sp.]
MKRQPVLLVGTLSLTAALAVGCSDGGKGDGGQTATTRPADVAASSTSGEAAAKRTGPPTGVVTDAVTSGDGRAILTEDSVVSLSATGARTCRLTAQSLVAPRTPKWRIEKVDDLQLGCAGEWLALAGSTLVLPYVKETPDKGIESGNTEKGVLGLNLDGSHRWHTAIADVDTVIGANERFVLAADTRSMLPGSPEKRFTAVLDADSGRMLWQLPGLNPVGIDGNVVLSTNDANDKLMALDATSGQQRWSTGMSDGSVGFIGTGIVAVPLLQNPKNVIDYDAKVLLHDVNSGAVLYTEPDTALFPTCVSDGTVAVVCQADGGGVDGNLIFSFDLRTKQRSWGIPHEQVRESGIRIRLMVDGRLFVATKTGGALVDAATGKQVAHSLAVTPDLVRGAYGIDHHNNTGRKEFSVYRLTW